MISLYTVIEVLHILSATVLFGTGLGTAFYFWMAHRTRDPRVIAAVGRHVVLGDWIFTGGAGLVQPITGVALIVLSNRDVQELWLMLTFALYALAFACWAPVVWIQIETTRLAAASAAASTGLPPRYFVLMRAWFWLGWPAFLALIAIIFLMITQPVAG